ncbi:MAG TPA: hypothetical protein VFZ64_00130 [Nocardioidaceae bacterium]
MDDQTSDAGTSADPSGAAARGAGDGTAPPPATTAAEVLRGIGFATYLASGVVAGLIVVMWGMSTEADFPGRYLMLLLPLLAAGWALGSRADDLDRRAARRANEPRSASEAQERSAG